MSICRRVISDPRVKYGNADHGEVMYRYRYQFDIEGRLQINTTTQSSCINLIRQACMQPASNVGSMHVDY